LTSSLPLLLEQIWPSCTQRQAQAEARGLQVLELPGLGLMNRGRRGAWTSAPSPSPRKLMPRLGQQFVLRAEGAQVQDVGAGGGGLAEPDQLLGGGAGEGGGEHGLHGAEQGQAVGAADLGLHPAGRLGGEAGDEGPGRGGDRAQGQGGGGGGLGHGGLLEGWPRPEKVHEKPRVLVGAGCKSRDRTAVRPRGFAPVGYGGW
jgi:hypothetical protein